MSVPKPTPTTNRARGNPLRNNPLPQNESKDVISIVPAISAVPEVSDEDMKLWMSTLYDISGITDADIKALYDAYSYKGFNRLDVLKQMKQVINDARLALHIIVATAMRGPQQTATIRFPNGKTPIEMGIPASGGQGTKVLTLNKIQAATADIAAFYLKKINIPKRLGLACPGWLQFPSAGAIIMPNDLRQQHLEFSQKFSEIIGGVFQPQIYEQMISNAYYDVRLKLFDE